MKYQINPIIVDAVQWDGTMTALTAILALANPNQNQIRYTNNLSSLMIVNNAGTIVVGSGDCIVRGYSPDLFVIPQNIVTYLLKKVE